MLCLLVVVFGTGVAMFGVLCGFCRRVAYVTCRDVFCRRVAVFCARIGGMDEKISLDEVNVQDTFDVPDVAPVVEVVYGDGE